MAKSRVVPVIGVPDVEGSISRELVAALHLMDLRIRSMNLIFPVRDPELLLESKAEDNWSDEINAKRKSIVKATFIPNQSLNERYYLRSLEGMTMTVLDPTNTNGGVQGASAQGVVGEDPLSIANSIRGRLNWGSAPIRQYRIAIGRPHRLIKPATESNPTSVNIALLQITAVDFASKIINGFRVIKNVDADRVSFVEKDIMMNYNRVDTTFSLFSLPGLRDGDANVQRQIKAHFSADEESRLIAQWKEILGQIQNEESGSRTYLPVVFSEFVGGESAATNFALEFASIGFSMSLLDLGVFYSKYLGYDANSPNGSSKMAQEHARGDALDLSLVPYYAISGMTLKAHRPFVLSQEFDPRKHTNPAFQKFHPITDSSGRSAYISPIIKVVRQPSLVQENSQASVDQEFVSANQEAIRLIIRSILGAGGIETGSDEIFNFDDLPEDDQHWYHQSVERVKLLPAAKLETPVALSRTESVSSGDTP